ncbi:MAG: ribosomal-protein-alanine N-acetyltransferase [Desulfobacteraceae bacterium 4572_35.1]|nr:MAG: ribosomal-protein-alanine N-acetyltransferase [Desulfobacteraceae bacterium 4572_35.1]
MFMTMGENGLDCQLREMDTEDLPQVLIIEQACYPQPWSAQMFQHEMDNHLAHLVVCEQNGQVLGYICFWHVASEVEIHNVATKPTCQGHGIGGKLMTSVLNYVANHKVNSVFLEVRSSNTPAIRLYEKFCFKPTSLRKKYYADGEDALLMEWRQEPSGFGKKER